MLLALHHAYDTLGVDMSLLNLVSGTCVCDIREMKPKFFHNWHDLKKLICFVRNVRKT